jgi:adenine-specific DNA-methyltransferase
VTPVDHDRGTPAEPQLEWPGKREAIILASAAPRGRLAPVSGTEPASGSGQGGHRRPSTSHLFIEGENLAVLQLLRPTHAGRIRAIYLDPPYNTGGAEKVYRDRFAPAEWLSMMAPRLVLARELLCDEGTLFVSIDDHEVHRLRLLMDEIFGPGCFRNCIVVSRGTKSVQAQFGRVRSLALGHEYVLFYTRSPEARFAPLRLPRAEPRVGSWNNHWRGTDRPTMRYELLGITPARGQWRWGRERSLRALENYRRMLRELGCEDGEVPSEAIDAWHARERARSGERVDLLRLSARGKPEHYVPPADTRLGSDLWTDLPSRGSDELEALLGVTALNHPKPVALLRRILQVATEPGRGDLVLDFFAGSGTTAHAVLEQNAADGGDRRFLLVQHAEPLPRPVTLPDGTRLHTLADVARERIRRLLGEPFTPASGFGIMKLEV